MHTIVSKFDSSPTGEFVSICFSDIFIKYLYSYIIKMRRSNANRSLGNTLKLQIGHEGKCAITELLRRYYSVTINMKHITIVFNDHLKSRC